MGKRPSLHRDVSGELVASNVDNRLSEEQAAKSRANGILALKAGIDTGRTRVCGF